MQNAYTVTLLLPDESRETAELQLIERMGQDFRCRIVLRFQGQEWESAAHDFYLPIKKIWAELIEGEGINLLCNATSKNVGNTRQLIKSSFGRKVYRMRVDEADGHAYLDGMIDAFAYDEEEHIVCTPEEQKVFYEEWEALPSKRKPRKRKGSAQA